MIDSFKGPYRFLSNFYPCSICYEGIAYPSVEHAYQASKTLNFQDRFKISKLEKPGQAKKFGKKLKPRDRWDSIKVDIMVHLVREKFCVHRKLRRKLLDTGNEILIEGNTWGDTFWGQCNGEGKNYLGYILMQVRDELK